MPQFTIQELKWLDQVLRRDIDNSKALLPSYAERLGFEDIIKLDIANKEDLRAKVNQTKECAIKRMERQR